jgi:hypothetical protein
LRILFYLPVVTPWWFQEIIVPMLRALHGAAEPVELHVMIAPTWRGTGLEANHLWAASDLTSVQWHVIDEGEPDQFRLAGAEVPGLLDLVAAIDPDVTLARSADIAIARQFPGVVRFIMEGGAPPFASDQRWIVLDEEPFTGSVLPTGMTGLADDCARRLRPAWDLAARQAPGGTRAALRNLMGLPAGRPVLALPLNYEHPENYFLTLAAYPDGISMIEGLLAAIDDDVVLAVTDHPLNRRHVDRGALDAFLAQHAGRVIDCTGKGGTDRLAICADAMLADLGKSWSLAAFNTMPLVDIGRHTLAPWLRAVPGISALNTDRLAAGSLAAADQTDARRWFGWHLGTRIIDPRQLTLGRLERAIAQQASDADIAGNLSMVLAHQLARADQEAAA